ncbi:MAG: hypothetical protein IKA49_04305 [Alistipes sp.]|nr:hypothetical protein [Alistipes sp.]
MAHLLKIGDDEIIFVRSKGAKAQHTLAYVSISLSAGLCRKNSSVRLFKIGDDEIIFVRSKGAKAEHTLAYVSISLSADSCKKNSSERFS